MKKLAILSSIAMLGFAALACTCIGITPPTIETLPLPVDDPTVLPVEPIEPPAVEETESPVVTTDVEFPMPDDAQNVMELGGGAINFQTGLSLKEVAEFYREAFANQGLTERTITTLISEDVVNLVFDGAPNGQAVVVQAIPLGDTTNVNVRYEDV
jgi:hypothetical protein